MTRRELVLGAVTLGLMLSAYAGRATYAETPPACLPPDVSGLDPRLPCTVPLDVEVGNRGVTLRWSAAAAETILGDKFGGYKIWRWRVPRGYSVTDPSDPGVLLPDTSSYTLIQVLARRDTTALDYPYSFDRLGADWSFNDPDDLFTFRKEGSVYIGPGGVEDSVWNFRAVDRIEAGPINGFPYYYAVTYFGALYDPVFNQNITSGLSSKMPDPAGDFAFPVYPGGRPESGLEEVAVIPNPYSSYAAWEFFGQQKLQFVNLPDHSAVEIFTTAGDFVKRIELDAGARGTGDVNSLDWDLRTEAGEEVTAGIYIYRVRAPNGRDTIGRFVVIR